MSNAIEIKAWSIKARVNANEKLKHGINSLLENDMIYKNNHRILVEAGS